MISSILLSEIPVQRFRPNRPVGTTVSTGLTVLGTDRTYMSVPTDRAILGLMYTVTGRYTEKLGLGVTVTDQSFHPIARVIQPYPSRNEIRSFIHTLRQRGYH